MEPARARSGLRHHPDHAPGRHAWVSAHSHAVLLRCPCANCSEPIRVTNRSWANKVGGKHLDVEAPDYLCPDCSEIQKHEEAERQQRAAEQRRAEQEREKQRAEELELRVCLAIEEEEAKTASSGSLPADDPQALALYVALASRAAGSPGKPLPSITSTGSPGWTGDTAHDGELLRALYRSNLLAVARETPAGAFSLSQDSDDITFRAQDVVWRLVGGLAVAQERVKEITYGLQTRPGQRGADARSAVASLAEQMDVTSVAAYLDALLGDEPQRNETGAEAMWRCIHPAEVPGRHQRDDAPEPAATTAASRASLR